MTSHSTNQLPEFLQSYEDLNSYIRDTFDTLDNTSKGRSFAQFVSKIIPISTLGDQYTEFEMGKDSKDGGVDLTSISTDKTTVLYGQSKLTISKAEEIDTIVSKFKNYYEQIHKNKVTQIGMVEILTDQSEGAAYKKGKKTSRRGKGKGSLIVENEVVPEEVQFIIVTLSKIKNRILPEYEKSRFSSREYYQELTASGKLIILDGPEVLPLAQSAYRKLHFIPTDVDVSFMSQFIKHDNVYIGVLRASELKKMYRVFGDALFIENVRLFLGYSSGKNDRENVNDSIRYTAEYEPQEMLARNNGLTFRASKVTFNDRDSLTLHLEQASIVNGCQTTRCIVDASRDDACVLVKIVEMNDSWSIAKSANFQTKVDTIALEVARYMRPSALQAAAGRAGIAVEDKNETLFDVFDSIYQERVRYDEAFFLFLGIFSRSPNNVINKNYTELRSDLLEGFQKSDPQGEAMFELLFSLNKAAIEGRKVAENRYQGEAYRNIFQRFWKEGKPDYRSLITILAACGCVRRNIYEGNITITQLEVFIDNLRDELANEEGKFVRYYCYAYEAIMSFLRITNAGKTDKDIHRTMYDDLKVSDFNTLYDQICIVADGREEH